MPYTGHTITHYMKLTNIPHAKRQGTRGGERQAWKFNFPEIDTLFVINQVFLNVFALKVFSATQSSFSKFKENMNTISTKLSTYSNSLFFMLSYLGFDLQSIQHSLIFHYDKSASKLSFLCFHHSGKVSLKC